MKRSTLWALVGLVVLGQLGCDGPAESGASGLLRGQVVAGPSCPVVSEPPDPDCADRPVAGALVIIQVESGDEVDRRESNADGRFETSLPPGRYTLIPQPVQGLLGTAPVQQFAITAGEPTELVVPYDTGIR